MSDLVRQARHPTERVLGTETLLDNLADRIEELEGSQARLISHIGVMSIELTSYSEITDASTESWISLPPELQELINTEQERLEREAQE